MERLTIRGDHGMLMAPGYDFRIDPDDYDLVQEILARLADHEDTGLEPEEVRTCDQLATNLQPEANDQQITESLQCNGFRDSETLLASKKQVKGIRLMSRPWEPQDLLDDLQLIIDEEPDRHLNDRRTTLCMARDFLKEHFAEGGWISVKERLPEENTAVIAATDRGVVFQCWYAYDGWDLWEGNEVTITHWMPLPEPPKGE